MERRAAFPLREARLIEHRMPLRMDLARRLGFQRSNFPMPDNLARPAAVQQGYNRQAIATVAEVSGDSRVPRSVTMFAAQ